MFLRYAHEFENSVKVLFFNCVLQFFHLTPIFPVFHTHTRYTHTQVCTFFCSFLILFLFVSTYVHNPYFNVRMCVRAYLYTHSKTYAAFSLEKVFLLNQPVRLLISVFSRLSFSCLSGTGKEMMLFDFSSQDVSPVLLRDSGTELQPIAIFLTTDWEVFFFSNFLVKLKHFLLLRP